MKTAKIIRHRHKIVHSINDDVKSVYTEDFYKILFSHEEEMQMFLEFVEDNGGKYKWDKETNKTTEDSKVPDKGVFEGCNSCMCDVFSMFVSHFGWEMNFISSPYKFEVWIKE